MKQPTTYRFWSSGLKMLAATALLMPVPALSYTGPGAGLAAIGVFLGFIAAIAIAAFGVIWYPAKRLIKSIRKQPADKADQPQKKDPAKS